MYNRERVVDHPTLPPSAAAHPAASDGAARVPGVVVLFAGGAPTARVMALQNGVLELGRGEASAGKLDDG
ncbi:MAG: hypothetical protein JWM53_3624, partial [bacterium]|nr:hypothetical protein [bacterium]